MNKIILFDGTCNFCNWNVLFIINRDPKAKFKFTSLQSTIGKQLVIEYNIREDENSLILIENDKFYVKSTAALKICKNLASFWRFFHIFIIVPKWMRDSIYTFIATNRYKWFGKNDACMVPSSAIKERFL